jgi:hypothetical protein
MKKYFFVFAFFNFILSSCGKTNVNPDHVNKFTCKVNGVFWEALPNERDILGNDLQMGKSAFSDFASIFANNTKKNQTIGFNMSLSDSVKVFTITNNHPFSSRGCEGYDLDNLVKHEVLITEHDKTKRIAKGTFSFRAINRDVGCVDTVSITEGFFDMHY